MPFALTEYKLDIKRDAFLLLCTDGVWNIMSSQEAVDVAYSARQRKVHEGAVLHVLHHFYQTVLASVA